MTEGDEIGHTEKVWVLCAALDRDAWMHGCVTVPPRGCRGVDSTASAAFFRGPPEHCPRAAL